MPSSPGYKRNYKQEWANAKARGEDEDNAQRHRARYEMEKAGKVHRNDGRDVGHKTAVKRGGTNAPSNLRLKKPSKNRSFSRNSDHTVKKNTPQK